MPRLKSKRCAQSVAQKEGRPPYRAFVYPLPIGAHECKRPDILGFYEKLKKKTNWTKSDEVIPAGRPAFGWGRCLWREKEDDKALCPMERFCSKGPFCKEHMRFKLIMKRIKAGQKELGDHKIDTIDPPSAEERFKTNPPAPSEAGDGTIREVPAGVHTPLSEADLGGRFGFVPPEDIKNLADACAWKTIDDVIVFTQKLARMCILGKVNDREIRPSLSICRVAIKAFDSKYLILKLSNLMRAVSDGALDPVSAVEGVMQEIDGRTPTDATSMGDSGGLETRSAGLLDAMHQAERIIYEKNKRKFEAEHGKYVGPATPNPSSGQAIPAGGSATDAARAG